jgi:hypothetical protein
MPAKFKHDNLRVTQHEISGHQKVERLQKNWGKCHHSVATKFGAVEPKGRPCLNPHIGLVCFPPSPQVCEQVWLGLRLEAANHTAPDLHKNSASLERSAFRSKAWLALPT